MGDPAEAEDLALETFFRLYERKPLYDSEFNPGGWLHRVATSLGLHSIRSWKRRECYEMDARKYAIEETPEDRPAEERRLVRMGLSQMNERQSQLLIMRYSGFPYKEIAKALGLAPTSIGPLLVRADGELERIRFQHLKDCRDCQPRTQKVDGKSQQTALLLVFST